MENLKIAIIDSGVDKTDLYQGISIHLDDDTGSYKICGDFNDQNGHGTIVTNIIESHIKCADLFIVKIFGDEEEIETEKLIFALDYLAREIHPQLIHLSMGVSFCDRIRDLEIVCENLARKGTIVISAYDNDGSLSYPAAFSSVIGVESSSKIRKTTEYIFLKESPINVAAIGVAQRLKGKEDRYFDVVGSSFAAPYITAIIANILQKEQTMLSMNEVLLKLQENAKDVYTYSRISPIEQPFAIKRAIVLPYNKEINTLIRFADDLTFELFGVYDLKFLNNIGKEITTGTKTVIIEPIEKIPWMEAFDTVVLGHLGELNSISNRNYTEKIVSCCIEYRKNLYSFDQLNIEQQKLFKNAGLKYFTPTITEKNVPYNQEGKLRQIAKPILCIAGTSSKQGKFSLQMRLKRSMKKQIRVGMLSTEPSGYLLGADVVFPVGYRSTISLENGDQYIAAINAVMGMIEDKDVDLIITGLQSQTIPMKLCNLRDMVICNHYCLLGVNPDAVVLVVNVFDDFDYIKRTIYYLENIIVCDVISIVVFPIMRTFKWNTLGDLSVRYNEETLQDFKEKLGNYLDKPVFILDNDKDLDELVSICFCYFLQEVKNNDGESL